MLSLQDTYGKNGICFGCGPKNEKGLQIKSFPEGENYVCRYFPKPEHQAFEGALNGGIIGSIFDCHSNWSSAHALYTKSLDQPFPVTVTSNFCVNLKRPTPYGLELLVTTKIVYIDEKKVVVEGEMEANGKITATFNGTFFKVEEGHPAYHRWD